MDITVLSLLAVFFCSALSAMGLGGGSILLLWLLFFSDLPQTEAQALNLFLFLPTAALSTLLNRKNKLLNISSWKRFLPIGIAGSILGSILNTMLPTELLKKCFGIFLLWTAGKELYTLWQEHKQKLSPKA